MNAAALERCESVCIQLAIWEAEHCFSLTTQKKKKKKRLGADVHDSDITEDEERAEGTPPPRRRHAEIVWQRRAGCSRVCMQNDKVT